MIVFSQKTQNQDKSSRRAGRLLIRRGGDVILSFIMSMTSKMFRVEEERWVDTEFKQNIIRALRNLMT